MIEEQASPHSKSTVCFFLALRIMLNAKCTVFSKLRRGAHQVNLKITKPSQCGSGIQRNIALPAFLICCIVALVGLQKR